MNTTLQTIIDSIQQSAKLDASEKRRLMKALKEADKAQGLTQFELDRVEKDRHTLSLMLEESILDIEKKGKAIEKQNRELEIESALEKVRSSAMGMNEPADMLGVCKIICQQLELLHVKDIRNVQTAIFHENLGSYTNFEFYAQHDKLIITETKYNDHPTAERFAMQMLKGANEIWIHGFKGEEVKKWLNYQKTTNVFIDARLETADSLTYYWYSLGPVALGISTYTPLNGDEINLFKRFRNVFELAYRRYLDIEKAQIQTREAEIQLALERIRARTAAMQESKDLANTASDLFRQLLGLGIKHAQIRTCAIVTFYDDRPVGECWIAGPDGDVLPNSFSVPYNEIPTYKTIYEAWQRGEQFLVVHLSGNQLIEHQQYLAKFTSIPIQKFKGSPDKSQETYTHAIFYSRGYLLIISSEPLIEYHDIFKRVGAVFQQTYTRFLDLQKAEVQARESKIQLALERVRAKTMAMQKSDELQETTLILFQQFKSLGTTTAQVSICIFDEQIKTGEMFVTLNGEKIDRSFRMNLDEEVFVMKKARNAFLNKEKNFSSVVKGQELQRYNHWRNDLTGKNGWDESDAILSQSWHIDGVFFSRGLMGISSELAPTAEALRLLERFTNVFDLTFTRFLDLQKAETQARESHVELSLERVRARTMAMHDSQDVADTVGVMFDELKKLGVETLRCGIGIIHGPHDMEVWTARTGEEGNTKLIIGHLNTELHVLLQGAFAGWQAKRETFSYELKDHDLVNYFNAINNYAAYPVQYDVAALPSLIFHNDFFFPEGTLFAFTTAQLSDEARRILKRFANIFGQTYRRYLDLQKAEAQAREAQIEASLERVRARTMAMHKSSDVLEVISILSEQFRQLGYKVDLANFNTSYWEKDWDLWIWVKEATYPHQIHIPYFDHPYFNSIRKSLEEGKDLHTSVFSKEEKDSFQRYLYENVIKDVTPQQQQPIFDAKGFALSLVFSKNTSLMIGNYDAEPYTDEQNVVLRRFANVFEQSYTRFLDLQKAEAQAREATIEAALERVRSKAMAMHNSDDILSTTTLVFGELEKLGITSIRCGVALLSKNSRNASVYAAATSSGGELQTLHRSIEMTDHSSQVKQYQSWLNQENYFVELKGDELRSYYKLPFFYSSGSYVPPEINDESEFGYYLPFSEGLFYAWTRSAYTESEVNLLNRFKTIIGLTFRRFLDLQKAEAQARESQIQLALERVRARTMAMQKSEELAETSFVLFQQFKSLGETSDQFSIGIFNEDENSMELYSTVYGSQWREAAKVDLDEPVVMKKIHAAWKKQEKSLVIDLSGDDLEKYNTYRKKLSNLDYNESRWVIHISFFARGVLTFSTVDPRPPETVQLLERFSGVFDLTFRRFLDLQKAEMQARESQIEAALEKVRGNAMAMHNSSDMATTALMVFTELRRLGLTSIRCGVGLLNTETRKALLYSAGDSLSLVGWVLLTGHPVLEAIYTSWENMTDYFPELSGEQLKLYYDKSLSGLTLPSIPEWRNGERQYGHFIPFSVGTLYAWADAPYDDAQIKIFKRFASIIDLTFRRYLELQKSEANAKEAVKQASLDRIRADIASMRTVTDLDRITPLVWNELTILGIPFIRCGVFIMDDAEQLIHTFLSTPEGKAIGAFHLPYSTPGNISKVLQNWRRKQMYVDHWNEDSFREFASTLVKQGALTSADQYLQTIPHGGFHLHFVPFLQGMLYVGNTNELTTEQVNLIQSLADSFSTAYARYEDFNKLEAAKLQVEKTLVDLKQAQQQLVQAEKMASLGELTAGIAHEIQNPLNFVNNFAEVSNELIDEMKEELSKGHRDEAELIASDLKNNLEKINHHGKRADAIVKGMLQHSRVSSGQKELTDINLLADEYLRLAYHGLRAKDKTFNAKFETSFDQNAGKLTVVPQDIGRVILNLINNAFYAVTEKKKLKSDGYEPTVSIGTKNFNDRIEVTISDNGSGIPAKALDKIFQPFFTTKPTGQGTGLGLSLAYDIVKAHDGDMKVNTKENEGSTFTIFLPKYQDQ